MGRYARVPAMRRYVGLPHDRRERGQARPVAMPRVQAAIHRAGRDRVRGLQDSPALWCRAIWEAGKCKNGCSALELKRQLEVSYRTALFMLNRLRHAMTDGGGNPPKLTGTVEVDETYVGGRPRRRNNNDQYKDPASSMVWRENKSQVVAIVQRDGTVRTNTAVANLTGENMRAAHPGQRGEVRNPGHRWINALHRGRARVPKPLGCAAPHRRVRRPVQPEGAHEHGGGLLLSAQAGSINGTYTAVSAAHLHRYVARPRSCTTHESSTTGSAYTS